MQMCRANMEQADNHSEAAISRGQTRTEYSCTPPELAKAKTVRFQEVMTVL